MQSVQKGPHKSGLWNEPQAEQHTLHTVSYGFIQQAGIAAHYMTSWTSLKFHALSLSPNSFPQESWAVSH